MSTIFNLDTKNWKESSPIVHKVMNHSGPFPSAVFDKLCTGLHGHYIWVIVFNPSEFICATEAKTNANYFVSENCLHFDEHEVL